VAAAVRRRRGAWPARVSLGPGAGGNPAADRGHWLLARRSLHDPEAIAYYACFGPRRSSWRAWYAHITLSMLALAWLSAVRAQAAKGEPAPATRA